MNKIKIIIRAGCINSFKELIKVHPNCTCNLTEQPKKSCWEGTLSFKKAEDLAWFCLHLGRNSIDAFFSK